MIAEKADIVIIGAGIAGMVCALEALKKGKKVVLLDAKSREKIGGLARHAFGGMALVGTREQKLKSIPDSPEIAFADWCSFAEFSDYDHWPKAWAKYYVEQSKAQVYDYVKALGVGFLPTVNWVERGQYRPGNSLPRYHILWGTSLRLVEALVERLLAFEGRGLTLYFNTRAVELIQQNNRVVGCLSQTSLSQTRDDQLSEFFAEHLVVATGGHCGNLTKVRKYWPKDWGRAPETLLNGAHPSNDGHWHQQVEALGGRVTHWDRIWPYAAGIAHPTPEFSGQGLSLIPCRSALWLDHTGQRIGPEPLVSGYDTSELCRQISLRELPHSWQLFNRRIALKELAVSGAEYNWAIRDRDILGLLKNVLSGNTGLFDKMRQENKEFLVADTPSQLVEKMNTLCPDHLIEKTRFCKTITDFDQILARKKHSGTMTSCAASRK